MEYLGYAKNRFYTPKGLINIMDLLPLKHSPGSKKIACCNNFG
jgi:hypothetical protein